MNSKDIYEIKGASKEISEKVRNVNSYVKKLEENDAIVDEILITITSELKSK